MRAARATTSLQLVYFTYIQGQFNLDTIAICKYSHFWRHFPPAFRIYATKLSESNCPCYTPREPETIRADCFATEPDTVYY